MRHFPRDIETAVRTLKEVCADPKNGIALRARAAELILSAYGLAVIPPERESRYRELKRVKEAVETSRLDKQLAAKVGGQTSKERRQQQEKLKQELAKL
jgi:hypothetical protein